ncbi:MAG TPA: enolase C-terminal domain-like protein [Flavobacterium sp.]|uniref:enolase C-terminal domain-like protein n=1 Tax=unclassified Flavobacterium TaxID=196869 RepID=UPI0025C045DA|nr:MULTISPECIES: enolase C-terminal domain-like protein [unclassified Flavobacterium]HRE77189.1 enolase C-terminal domain-like protein [Flavobacterium sp.]
MHLNWKIVQHQLKEPFKIAYGVYNFRKALIVSIDFDEKTGFGECTEIDYYHIHLDDFVNDLQRVQSIFTTFSIEHPVDFFKKLTTFSLHPFLQSAIDCAFWDLYGKLENKTFSELNQLKSTHFPQSSITISMDEEDIQLKKIIESDWEYFKVKVNSWSTSLRDKLLATGKNISIDSNGSFTLKTCEIIQNDSLSAEFLYFEQPMPKGAENYQNLSQNSYANWMADEDLQSIDDLEFLQNHYKTINIKVMKCGGLTPSLSIIQKAKAMNFQIMIGCMTESTVGISAGIALASFADYLDLDGANLIENDNFNGSKIVNGEVVSSEHSGLGIQI